MTRDKVMEYCRGLPQAAEKLLGHPSNILVYSIAGKQFAYFKTSEPEKWRFSFRSSPERYLELTDQPGIKPARYMHRFHWVTVVDVSIVPQRQLEELLFWSYTRAVQSLSRKLQAQIAL